MRRFLYASLIVGLTALLAAGAWKVSAAQGPPAATLPGQPGGSIPAFLVVTVPPDAEVEIEGAKTTTKGEVRHYKSPPLQVGVKYHYTIKATWMENGKPRTLEIKVPVTAGVEAAADFVKEAKKEPAKDTPAKDASAKDAPAKDAPPLKDLPPLKDTPAKDKPAADKPAADKPPLKDLPPIKDLPPLKDTPVKDKPAGDKDK